VAALKSSRAGRSHGHRGRRSPVAFVKSTLALLERVTTADVETVKRRVQALITILEAEVRTRRLREGTRDVAEGEQRLVVSPPRHAPQSRPDGPPTASVYRAQVAGPPAR
jgi:hypothetical protein